MKLLLALLFLTFAASLHAADPALITPGTTWLDDRGKPIQAHGGGITRIGDTFYWFGEDRSADIPEGTRCVACYASTDLVHWAFRNRVISMTAPGNLDLHWVLERPKVYYNSATKKFVMYMHIDSGNYALAHVGVATSDTIDGRYTYLRSFRPLDRESRDIGQFIDDDGTPYLLFESRPTGGFYIARLSADYLSIEKETAFIHAPLEAGALVHIGGIYYVLGSHMSGWDPNSNVYATAKTIEGPWSEFHDIATPAAKTYGAQTTFLLKIPGEKQTALIYLADLWKPHTLWDSRYLWMPLQIEGPTLRLPPPAPWSIDMKTGETAIQSL